MLQNFLVSAFRNFRKNRVYTLINALGLGLGMTCCLVMYTILRHEFGFDDFHSKKESIYRIVEHYQSDNGMEYSGRLPNPLGYTLAENKSKIQDVIPMHGPITATVTIRNFNKVDVYKDRGLVYTNSSFLRNLDFPIIRGASAEMLDEHGKVFLTEQLAEKYFGSSDPIGQFVSLGEDLDLEVVGILKNSPTTTNVPFEMLVSYPTLRAQYPGYLAAWSAWWMGSAYIVKDPRDDIKELEAEINNLVEPHLDEEQKLRYRYFLQPLAEVHTNQRYGDSVNYVPPVEAIYATLFLVACILIASILNFVNLATSLAVRRSREIGIRKTLGSSKAQIIWQFFGETVLIVTLGALIALTCGQFLINVMNNTVSPMPFYISYDWGVLPLTLAMIAIVSFLAAIYPSLVLASYNPTEALRNQISLTKGSGKLSLRKGLVIVQFAVANLLIVATIVVASQMRMIHSKDLGFDPSNIVTVHFPDAAMDKRDVILSEFTKENYVAAVTWGKEAPQSNGSNWNTAYHLLGKPEEDHLQTRMKFIDDQYLAAYKIPLIAGENLTSKAMTDSIAHLIVSLEFVKRLGFAEPADALGLTVVYNGSKKGFIKGVVSDFHSDKLTNSMLPVMMSYEPYNMNILSMKLKDGVHLQNVAAEIERKYRTFAPEALFEPGLLTDQIRDSYLLENVIYGSFQVFAVLSLFIGLMGLYGLVNYMIERNRKTMSIRKVFGASWKTIIKLISREYVILILISFVLVAPLSYLLCSQWLDGFAYQVEITVWHYLIGLFLIMLIAMSTVSIKSYRAAMSNPVDALRQE